VQNALFIDEAQNGAVGVAAVIGRSATNPMSMNTNSPRRRISLHDNAQKVNGNEYTPSCPVG